MFSSLARQKHSCCDNGRQVNKKPSQRESWWDIGFEGNGGAKSKETRVCNSKGKFHSPIFSGPFVLCSCAKYRTMTFSLTITDPCFLAFCTTIAFKSYIPSTFSLRRFFIYLFQ